MSYRGNRSFGYGNIRKAQKFHARRSPRAKRIDEGLKAPIAKSTEQWMLHKGNEDDGNESIQVIAWLITNGSQVNPKPFSMALKILGNTVTI